MYTAKELEAQEVFDKALRKAWDDYWAVEIPARHTQQKAAKAAFEDMEKLLCCI